MIIVLAICVRWYVADAIRATQNEDHHMDMLTEFDCGELSGKTVKAFMCINMALSIGSPILRAGHISHLVTSAQQSHDQTNWG